MPKTVQLNDEIMTVATLERGRALFDRLRPSLEPAMNGQVVAIHVDSGDYAVAKTSPAARFTLRISQPTGMIITTNIGTSDQDLLTLRMQSTQFSPGGTVTPTPCCTI